jgi:endonuclease/exonuclease/phosphatase (EEP) superfamily protein YafD
MRRALRLFFATALLAAGLALCGGFAGALHPAGDSLAVFRLPLAAAVLVAAFGLGLAGGPRRLAAFAALLATVAAAPAALSYLPRPVAGEGAAYTLYQKNVLSRLADPAPLVDDILASGAGIVTLQEVQQQNQPVLEALRPAYPTQAWCPYGGAGGTAVLSRWPALGEPLCAAGGGFTALRLDAPFGPVWAVSLHLYWPWPFDQARQATRLEPLLAGLEQPVILGGDFNMVPWAATTRRLAAATGTTSVGPTMGTFGLGDGLVPLAIDHVLLPTGWPGTQDLRPALGSDHQGLLVRFAPAP